MAGYGLELVRIVFVAARGDTEGIRSLPRGGASPAARAGAAARPSTRPRNTQGDGGSARLHRPCLHPSHYWSVRQQQ